MQTLHATTTVRVRVLRSDITEGATGNPTDCPIARALKRLVRPALMPDVCIALVGLYRRDREDPYSHRFGAVLLPTEARVFIRQFDATETKAARKALKPFAFSLDLPTWAIRGSRTRIPASNAI